MNDHLQCASAERTHLVTGELKRGAFRHCSQRSKELHCSPIEEISRARSSPREEMVDEPSSRAPCDQRPCKLERHRSVSGAERLASPHASHTASPPASISQLQTQPTPRSASPRHSRMPPSITPPASPHSTASPD